MKLHKKLTLFLLVSTMMMALAGCSKNAVVEDHNKMEVVTTIYPVYEVAKAVGGDKVSVSMLVSPGAEPHDWEPTVKDIRAIGKAKIFMYNGLGMEPVEKLIKPEVLKDAMPVDVSKAPGVIILEADEDEHEEDNHGKVHAEEHHHEGYDPHIWLNPENMIAETRYVVDAFSKVDPENASYYKERGEAYIKELQALNVSYKDWRSHTSVQTLVVTHEAFGYLANAYDLQQKGIMGLSSESEPTAEKMATLIEYIKEHHIHVIFSESFVNQKLAKTVAKETGAQIYTLHSIESITPEEMKAGANYISLMKENLATLEKAYSH